MSTGQRTVHHRGMWLVLARIVSIVLLATSVFLRPVLGEEITSCGDDSVSVRQDDEISTVEPIELMHEDEQILTIEPTPDPTDQVTVVLPESETPTSEGEHAAQSAQDALEGSPTALSGSERIDADVRLSAQDSTESPSVTYRTHVQTYGWQDWKSSGQMSGTSGQSKRLEGIELKLANAPHSGGITYRTHVQTYGWQGWRSDGQMSGTSGEAKRLEAIEIKLTGDMATYYDVYYRVHAQSYGWMGWAKNGERSGTATMGKRLEGIQVVIVRKGTSAPGATYAGVTRNVATPYATRQLAYRTHVQSYGWQGFAYDGATSGTVGKSKRLEGIEVKLADPLYSGSVRYRTHVQKYGWQGWRYDGQMSGTSGESKRLEAIQIELTDTMAEEYDVWYRVHAQRFGWMGWAKNGASAGTAGYAYRLEGIQIRLAPKGEAAPGPTDGAFRQGTDQKYVIKGNGWSFEIPSYWRDKVEVRASTSLLGKSYDFVPKHFRRSGWNPEYHVVSIEERAELVSRRETFLKETVKAKSGQNVEIRGYDMAIFLQADIRSGRSLLIWADTTFPEMATMSYPYSGIDKAFMAGLADLESFGAVKTYDEYMQHYRSDNYRSDCGYEYALARSCLRTLAKGLTIS